MLVAVLLWPQKRSKENNCVSPQNRVLLVGGSWVAQEAFTCLQDYEAESALGFS